MLLGVLEQEWHFPFGASASGQIYRRGKESFRFEPDVSRRGRANLIELDATDHEARHRDSCLDGGSESMDPAHSTPPAASIVLQRRHERETAEANGWHQSEDQRGNETQPDRRGIGPDVWRE